MGLFVLPLIRSVLSATDHVYAFGETWSGAGFRFALGNRAEFMFCHFENIHSSIPALSVEEEVQSAEVFSCNFINCTSDDIGGAISMEALAATVARTCAVGCKGQRRGTFVAFVGRITGEFRRINNSAVRGCQQVDESEVGASVTTNRDALLVFEFNISECFGRAAAIGIFLDEAKAQQHRLVATWVLAARCGGRCVVGINNLEFVSEIYGSLFVQCDCQIGVIHTGSSLDVFGCVFSDNLVPLNGEVVFTPFLSEGIADKPTTLFDVAIRIANCLFSSPEELETSVFSVAMNSWGVPIHISVTFACPGFPIPTGSPRPTVTPGATESSRFDRSAVFPSLLVGSYPCETTLAFESFPGDSFQSWKTGVFESLLGDSFQLSLTGVFGSFPGDSFQFWTTVVFCSRLASTTRAPPVFTEPLSERSGDGSSIQAALVVGIPSICLAVIGLAILVYCRRVVCTRWQKKPGGSIGHRSESLDENLEPAGLSLDAEEYQDIEQDNPLTAADFYVEPGMGQP
jgi:hypothetical protein